MQSLLIRNARMVNEGQVREGDLLVRHGRIERIAGCLENCGASREIDAAGRYLLPGMIDDQVHFREPGYPQKGSIASESRAAVAGGITSFMDMPNTRPATLSLEALAEKKRLAAAHSVANYGFHFGVSRDNLDTVAALDPREVAAVKVFMGASTGDMLVDDLPTLERLFASVPTLLLSHCEDTPRIEANLARWRQRFGERIPAAAHPRIRDAEACYRSTALAVELAQRHGTLLHVLHLSTARELALFEDKPLCQKRITAEVCVHHLLFDDSDYARLGHLLKCNPAIKSREDRDALRQPPGRDRHRPRAARLGREAAGLSTGAGRPATGPACVAGTPGAGPRRLAVAGHPGGEDQPPGRRTVRHRRSRFPPRRLLGRPGAGQRTGAPGAGQRHAAAVALQLDAVPPPGIPPSDRYHHRLRATRLARGTPVRRLPGTAPAVFPLKSCPQPAVDIR